MSLLSALHARFRHARKRLGRLYWDIHSKTAFLHACPPNAVVLDVGCGNNSPADTKAIRPDFHYVGIDVSDAPQNAVASEHADELIVTDAAGFTAGIAAMPNRFDAVISSHNIEHCDDPCATMTAMLRAIKPGGRLFMSFPAEASTRLPSRKGTLNFFDDPTHKTVPEFRKICAAITAAGFRLDVAIPRYRPPRFVLRGLLEERASRRQNRVLRGTWALYGFETIIWATRPLPDPGLAAPGNPQ